MAMDFEETKVTFKIDYANEGDLVAQDVQLTQYVPSAFAGFGKTESGSISAVPAIPSDRITFGADRITWQLGDVEPGEGGSIFVSWLVDGTGSLSAASRAFSAGARYTSTAVITASNDVDLSNNVVQADVKQEPPPPTIGILQDPSVPFDLAAMVQRGTTCSNNIKRVCFI